MQQNSLKIDNVRPDRLRPNPWNTNSVGPDNELKLEASIKRFGVFKPVLCRELDDGSLEILGGEHRWRAAQKLGIKEVPVINLGKVDDTKAKEIGLVDNGRYGEDDPLQLSELLKSLGNTDEILEFMPIAEDELTAIFASSSVDLDSLDVPDDRDIPELPSTKVVQTHQIMRFKVPVDDCEWIQQRIEAVMKAQGFTGDDSMTNAGNAFVLIMKEWAEK